MDHHNYVHVGGSRLYKNWWESCCMRSGNDLYCEETSSEYGNWTYYGYCKEKIMKNTSFVINAIKI